MARIFLSYRRSDTSGYANGLYDKLAQHFGEGSILRDVDTIPAGVDFVRFLEEAVDSSDAVVALIGKDWLRVKDTKGRRRLDDPDDYLRLELSRALRRNIPVVPALVGGAAMPPKEKLPAELAVLANRNSLEISDSRWGYDVNRLVAALEALAARGPLLSPGPQSTSPPAPVPPARTPPPVPASTEPRTDPAGPGAPGASPPPAPSGGFRGRSMRVPVLVACVVTGIVLLAGIGALVTGSNGREEADGLPDPPAPAGNFNANNLARFAIVKSDLPTTYEYLTDESTSVSKDCLDPSRALQDAATVTAIRSLGYRGCHYSKWRKPGKAPDGLFKSAEVLSMALLFPDADKAAAAVPIMVKAVVDSASCPISIPDPHVVPDSGPGEGPKQAVTIKCILSEQYAFVWRSRNVTVLFFDASLELGQQRASSLARTIDARAASGAG